MSFSGYKSISAVAKEFQIRYSYATFIAENYFPVPELFKEDLNLLFNEGVVSNSEAAICENLIYPVLKEVWKKYYSKLTLWSHESLYYNEQLSGIPDYILAKRSPLGSIIFDSPYFLVIEAKQDNFTEGWGQCLAEMIAIQKINNYSQQLVFGAVSNGRLWQFGKLKEAVFTLNYQSYLIEDLDPLFAAVNYIFKKCELQVDELAQTTTQ
ncbi:MAG: hypothetical protein F6K10_13240 [Moorea sp. SIO2B7]|nr:hypothetical protein [Moorena sp. SIO2B7]